MAVSARLSANQDLDTWVVRPQRTFLIPKGRFAYRIASQPDPLDSLLYASLIYELGAQLESARIPVSEGCVQSNRFLGGEDGEMYDPEFSWSEFIARCEERVEDTAATHVLVADISDFFHRLYHHRIENTLQSACADEDGARVLCKMIHQWAGTTSYGLPVGPAASRLVAEVSLHDIDQILQGSGARFVRFVDDYRVFCTSHRQAYEKLTLLAESLFESHGLTLQPQKTHIVSRAAFQEKYLKSHRSKELEGLSEQFDEIASELGVGWYEPIDPNSLSESQMSAIEALNLHGLVHEQLNADELDIGLMNFLIWRLVQIHDASLAGDLVRHAESLYPVFPRVIAYLGAVGPRQVPDSAETAGELLALLSGSSVGHLPFHRALILWLFGADTKWASALAIEIARDSRRPSSRQQAASSNESRYLRWGD